MSATPNLGLPYIDAGQAQKHVTHNEALRALDTLVQLAVQDRDLAAPPASPSDGERWIVKAGATGAWSGHANEIAAWQDGAWAFSAPGTGWIAYVIDEEILVAWDGASWNAVSAGDGGGGGDTPTELQNLSLLGVGATADATNPLSAKLNNVLWAAKTVAEGGDGTLRYKMSKESADKVLSILFQDNFSGRAEIGLVGDDDFHFKVSPDGSSWLEAIRIDHATGRVSFPSGGAREVLTANRTYFVRSDGSDSNSGLANTSGGAFLTIQKAINTVYGTLDLGGFNVTIQIGAGTTYAGFTQLSPQVGAGTIKITGDTTTPSNVQVTSTITLSGYGTKLSVEGIKTTASASVHYTVSGGAFLTFSGKVDFGATTAIAHMRALNAGQITLQNVSYTISGNAQRHAYANSFGFINLTSAVATLSGSPVFSGAFAYADRVGVIDAGSSTFSGSTGSTSIRYVTNANSVINTGGGGASFFPGDTAGSATNQGLYL